MNHNLNITIRRIEDGTCDLTAKQAEVVVCVLPDQTECVISTAKFLEFLRFEQKKLERKNGATAIKTPAQQKTPTPPSGR